MKHKTGEIAPARGVYFPDCRCHTELRVRVGDVFAACSVCGKAVTWHFLRSVMSDTQTIPMPPVPPPESPS